MFAGLDESVAGGNLNVGTNFDGDNFRKKHMMSYDEEIGEEFNKDLWE